MAEVQAFRGLRYDLAQVGSLADVTAPPYDVISPEEQKELYERHPCNVVRLILNRQEPGDAGTDDRYVRAANFLRQWRSENILIEDRDESLYVYHQQFQWEGTEYVRKGFLARTKLEEFGAGHVYPHEETMPGPKADRLALTKACRANLSPIFSLYPDAESQTQKPLEDSVLQTPPLEVREASGVVHRVWPVCDRDAIQQVRDAMRDKPIFIADGHHRYETALNYRSWLQSQGKLTGESAAANHVLMMFVGMSDPGLAVLPTHRLVSGIPDITRDDLDSALSEYFELESVGTGADAARTAWQRIEDDGGQHVFGFGTTADRTWTFARLKDASPMQTLAPDHSPAWRSLGVSILHKLVLEHLIGRRYPQSQPECQYVHRLDEVIAAQSQRACQLACLVAPAAVHHVETIASTFERMPAKSTYFYPKLLSGLVFHALA